MATVIIVWIGVSLTVCLALLRAASRRRPVVTDFAETQSELIPDEPIITKPVAHSKSKPDRVMPTAAQPARI